jgi:hypothetical protein
MFTLSLRPRLTRGGLTLSVVALLVLVGVAVSPAESHAGTGRTDLTNTPVRSGGFTVTPANMEIPQSERTSTRELRSYAGPGVPIRARGNRTAQASTRLGCTWYGLCTVTLDVATTRSLCSAVCRYANSSLATIAVGAARACAPIGGYGALYCAGAAAIYGSWFMDELQYARASGRCLEFRAYRIPVPPYITPPWIGTSSVTTSRCTST